MKKDYVYLVIGKYMDGHILICTGVTGMSKTYADYFECLTEDGSELFHPQEVFELGPL